MSVEVGCNNGIVSDVELSGLLLLTMCKEHCNTYTKYCECCLTPAFLGVRPRDMSRETGQHENFIARLEYGTAIHVVHMRAERACLCRCFAALAE